MFWAIGALSCGEHTVVELSESPNADAPGQAQAPEDGPRQASPDPAVEQPSPSHPVSCEPLEFAPVDGAPDFPAFGGNGSGCYHPDLLEPTMYATQEEVDAYAEAYCHECCNSCTPQECTKAKGPKLGAGISVIYVASLVAHSPGLMEVLSVEDCGLELKVTALATSGCETAYGWVWDSVLVESSKKPVMLSVEHDPGDCFGP